MKTATMHCRNRAGPLAACLVLSLLGLTAVKAAPRRVVLPSGSVIPVRLDQSLSSKTAHSGDRFTATVRYGKDDAGLPEGTRVEGAISEVVRAANGKPGVLDMNFRRLVTPGGQARPLTGSLVSLDAKSVQRSESGRLVATADKGKDRLKWVGIGAGAGLLVGVLTKGNKLTDILLGAGAGYLYNEFGSKPKPGDVNLKSGAEFGIRLDRPLAFDTNRPDDYNAADSTPGNTGEYDDRNNSSPYYDREGTRTVTRPARDVQARESGGDIRMRIDDRDVSFGSAKPYMRNGISFVPLDPVARAANFTYRYNAQQRMIDVRNGALRMGIGTRDAFFNGERRRLNAAPAIRDGAVYVPMQFIGLATGGSADWDAGSRTLALTTDRAR